MYQFELFAAITEGVVLCAQLKLWLFMAVELRPLPAAAAPVGSARYLTRLRWLTRIFQLSESHPVEDSREKRRQQLMGLSFVAAAVGVLALLTIRLGACCSWFGSH